MKTIRIELSNYDYLDLAEKAKQTDQTIEKYIIQTSTVYKPVYETGLHTYRELMAAYRKIEELEKENKILKQNLGIKD